MKSGGTMTFAQLISEVQAIEIPIIQRDYAQGRSSVAEVRAQFLQAMFDTLTTSPEELTKPLDLDFVYGSMKGGSGEQFWPLDGQQRLTTLYLLHWYLACQDGEFTAFQNLVLDNGKSRFTYETRRSSAEFFSALASHNVDLTDMSPPSTAQNSLSASIRDSRWFFLSWNLDPTIQSALSMLDAIDKRFRGECGLYRRIAQVENPYITFQFLNLEEFGLSDDLYIKMNARGKPLTPFENFKAKFEQFAGQVCHDDTLQLHGIKMPLREYLGRKIDTDWSDLFWHFCDASTDRFDDQFMQFFRSMVGTLLPLGKTKNDRLTLSEQLGAIRKNGFNPSFYQYAELKCIDRSLVINLIDFMELVCGPGETFRTYLADSSYYDERSAFAFALEQLETGGRNPKGLTYQRAMMFYAWCIYLLKFPKFIDPAALFDWLRVIHNLTENTRVERPIEFTDALLSITDLANNADSIVDFLASTEEGEKISFFYTPQVREERIKAQLIQRSSDWREAIMQAEVHGYFKGQIEFLLDFSGVLAHFMEAGSCDWEEDQDLSYFAQFTEYFGKAEAVFDGQGLKAFPDNLFERALLTKGDYLLYGRSNESFLDNEDRDTSWKRLLRGSERFDQNQMTLKRKLLGELLAAIDIKNVADSLREVIDSYDAAEDWRLPFIARPELITYCENRYIRRSSKDKVYLMKRIQMNGAHLEIWTYYLLLDYLSELDDIYPFRYMTLPESYASADEPSVRFLGMERGESSIHLNITYEDGKYIIALNEVPILTELRDFRGFQEDANGYYISRIPKNEFRTEFPLVLERLSQLATNVREESTQDES